MTGIAVGGCCDLSTSAHHLIDKIGTEQGYLMAESTGMDIDDAISIATRLLAPQGPHRTAGLARLSQACSWARRCPARCATGSARGVALRDPHDRPLVREGGQGIWLQARRAGSCPLASSRSSAGLRWPAESCSMQQNQYKYV